MGVRDWFKNKQSEEITDANVLVCGLGLQFEEFVQADADAYRRFYPNTTATTISAFRELLPAIQGKDVLHFFCDVTVDGVMIDVEKRPMTGTELIDVCCDSNIKLLWIASANKPDGYIKNFNVREKRINLAMTIDRSGPKFTTFLQRLLEKMSQGKTMPVAWASLVPQGPGPWQLELPSCIIFAGRGGVVLR